jgi:SAM-dependent MidA family methyltransferase
MASKPISSLMIETIANTSTLAARLRERIRSEGPITFSEWMKAALYDPQDGYYCRTDKNKWGREGDYRTSPERSALFAATFARYFARLYEDLGRPSQWTIAEAGAGDGRFAGGVLQTLQRFFPDVFAATSYVIDEPNSHSCTVARECLEPFADRVVFKRLVDAQIDPGVVFSNEMMDAFPVHRVTMNRGLLQEFYVGLGRNEDFEWLLDTPSGDSATRLAKYFAECGIELSAGQIAEVNPGIEPWLGYVAERMCQGYVVTVDYGEVAEDLYSSLANPKGTLRGFHRHTFVDDLLARPGEHDLTTTINWSFVMSVGARLGLEVVEFERQDRFLLAAGLLEQLEVEARQCETEAERLRATTAAREMIFPDGMASKFQVLVQRKA